MAGEIELAQTRILRNVVGNDKDGLFGKSMPVWQGVYHSAAGWTKTGDTAETTVLNLVGVVPADVLGANGVLRITPLGSCLVNDASVKTIRVKINGVTVDTVLLTSARVAQKQFILSNRNSKSSQVATGASQTNPFSTSSAAIATFVFDTSAALDVAVSIQNAAAGDSTTLERILIEVLPVA